MWERTGGVDGYVSLEVDPTLAYDRQASYEQAMRFHREVDRRNLYVKIPGTEPGLGAIEDCIAEGRSINVTLIFSLERYAAVVEAYLRGLERLVEAGGDPGSVISVASFFVSRVDTEADRRLEELGRQDLQGRLAIANAKLAYAHWKEAFSGSRWDALAAKGARTQRCLWASTSTKNPEYRDVLYVEELIGRDVVNTMPAETIRAFQDHGEVRDTLETGLDDARAFLDELRDAGVDYDDVVETLEREGVEKFSESFSDLLDGITKKLQVVVQTIYGEPARGRARDPAQTGSLCARRVRRLGRPDEAEALPGALRARIPRPPPRSVRGHRRGTHRADHEAVPDRDPGRGQAVRARPVPLGRLRLACGRSRVRGDGVRRRQRRGPRRRRPGGGRSERGGLRATASTISRSRRRRSRRSCARSASAASARAGRA